MKVFNKGNKGILDYSAQDFDLDKGNVYSTSKMRFTNNRLTGLQADNTL